MRQFEEHLEKLNNDLIDMAKAIQESIRKTCNAIKNSDKQLAQEVIDFDDTINDMEKNIENECIHFIILHHPLATDLRLVTSILKMITDLERIADNCSDICKHLLAIFNMGANPENNKNKIAQLTEMNSIVDVMFEKTVKSYRKHDNDAAKEIAKSDDLVDDIYNKIEDYVMKQMIMEPQRIKENLEYLYIAKYLERMADHITNVCEWIVYCETGKHKKYN